MQIPLNSREEIGKHMKIVENKFCFLKTNNTNLQIPENSRPGTH